MTPVMHRVRYRISLFSTEKNKAAGVGFPHVDTIARHNTIEQ